MEVELRKQLALKKVPELSEDTKQTIIQNDNVQFFGVLFVRNGRERLVTFC